MCIQNQIANADMVPLRKRPQIRLTWTDAGRKVQDLCQCSPCH